ncbi:hydantoinase/oxoprolinase family protein [Saccharopolyspora thermophila]|uniref:hydantoinase/oxoprolinase family protein n=1 Tax=Saccharopolyspora thermophila TaxID=89367 RepID=UPI001E5DA2AD|nr:hydantoinase/oxoprolinase family protein [Saccharopolyspora subtropica]
MAIDTGGTFTDIAVNRPDNSVFVWKVPSTPHAPDEAVIAGLTEALSEVAAHPHEVAHFVHGTTVATNTVITRTGARVGLVTTDGFRDLLAIGHQTRPSLYDQTARRPHPLAPAELTWEVRERLAADGSELTPVDQAQLAEVTSQIRAAEPDVVVVSLLNAYVNPAHEHEIVEVLRKAGVARSVFAATSVTSEMREYERTSTAVLNGYVQPKIAGYLDRLDKRLSQVGVPARLWVMQSNGGLLGSRVAQEQSVRTVLSGLAGGVVGAARWARQLDLPSVVSIDIGGTSTDIALIRNGVPDEMTAGEIEGYPLRMPMVDVHTIGAGGGSIAWQDSGDSLRVGPHSAGARPGPVCYGQGGTDITVTDAHALLGRLGDSLLDGRLPLDLPVARHRLSEFARKVGLGDTETAAGILHVVNATMGRGIRKVSIERGVDLRQCTLMAFGGAGPLHASELIRELGMRAAVVPPHPGIASAVGMLDTPVRHDFARSVSAMDASELPSVSAALDSLAAQARDFLADSEGISPADAVIERAVDARYLGQSFELRVAWTDDFAELRRAFDTIHEEHYGFCDPDAALEIVTARVTVTAAWQEQHVEPHRTTGGVPEAVGRRRAHFDGEWYDTPVYRREQVPAHARLTGPLVLHQLDSTTVICPGQACWHDEHGFLHIHPEEAR